MKSATLDDFLDLSGWSTATSGFRDFRAKLAERNAILNEAGNKLGIGPVTVHACRQRGP